MFKHFLVPIDGSALSDRAIQASLALAAPLGARITGFVVEPFPPTPPDSAAVATNYTRRADAHLARTEAHARRVLDAFAAKAAQAGVPFEGRFRRTDGIDEAIVEAAREYGCDLVVMVTHGRGAVGELVYGSHTKNVMSRCEVPLLVLR